MTAEPNAFEIPSGFNRSTFLRRFLMLLVIPNVVFGLIAYVTEAPWFIAILNGISLALSAGVCVAFLPAIFTIFFAPQVLEKGDYLSFGIWLTWFAVILQAVLSIWWRSHGMPAWMVSTDFTSYFLFMRVCGAVFHLAAPGAVDNRIPTRRWVFIGLVIASAVGAVLALGWALNAREVRDIGHLVG